MRVTRRHFGNMVASTLGIGVLSQTDAWKTPAGRSQLCSVEGHGWTKGSTLIHTATQRLLQMKCGPQVTVRLERVDSSQLGTEGYALHGDGRRHVVTANTDRGALYGAFALAHILETEKNLRPDHQGDFTPYFPYREWWSAAYQANFNLPLGGAFDRPIWEISASVRRIIHEAPTYGVNTLQLMGRAGEGGIDMNWFLHYDGFPKLQHLQLGWGIGRRTEEIRKLAAEAHSFGMDFVLWDHELAFPDNMLEAYPELRGTDNKICFSHPLVFKFLEAKIDEFFRRLPEVDGLDVTFAETHGYNLLTAECQCERCKHIPKPEKIRRVITVMHKRCRLHKKRLDVRSYNQTPGNAKAMRVALQGLPNDIRITTKNTVVDFRGTGYPDNPMLGAFPQQPEMIELTACPEGNGYGYIPALLADFYKDKIARLAVDRKLSGVAIRTDYTLQFGHETFFTTGPPVLTFDTANEFNIVVASRLAWNPSLNINDLWAQWSRRRYGSKAATVTAHALKRTAAISQGIFFVKGFSLLTHLDMVGHLVTIDNELAHSYLTEFFPNDLQYRKTYDELSLPSDDTIAEILEEKSAAAAAAHVSLNEILAVGKDLPQAELWKLKHGLVTAENAALLWKQIAAVYFRLRRIQEGLGNKTTERKKLEEALRAFVNESARIEKECGRVWPIYPADRGVIAYVFAKEAAERGKLSNQIITRLSNEVAEHE